MRAGKLDRRIELQQFTLAGDGDPESGTWTTTSTVWAERMEKGGLERFISIAELAEASAAYRIRYHSTIDPTWRVKEGTEFWYVQSTHDGKGRDRETILLVTRNDPGDAS